VLVKVMFKSYYLVVIMLDFYVFSFNDVLNQFKFSFVVKERKRDYALFKEFLLAIFVNEY